MDSNPDPFRRHTRSMADIIVRRNKRRLRQASMKEEARKSLPSVSEAIRLGLVKVTECPTAWPEGTHSVPTTKGHPGRRPRGKR